MLLQKYKVIITIVFIIICLVILYFLYNSWKNKINVNNEIKSNRYIKSNSYTNLKENVVDTPTTAPTSTIISISHPTLGRLQNNNNNNTALTFSTSGPATYFLVNNDSTVFNNSNHRVTLQTCDINGTPVNNFSGYLIINGFVNNVNNVVLGNKDNNKNAKYAWYFAIQTDGTYLIYNDADTINPNGTFLYCDATNSLKTKSFTMNKQTWNINIISGTLPDFPPASLSIQIQYCGSITTQVSCIPLKYDSNDISINNGNIANAYNIRLNTGKIIDKFYINNNSNIPNSKYKRCAIYFIDNQYNARYLYHYNNVLRSYSDITKSDSGLSDLYDKFQCAWYFALQSSGKYILYNDYGLETYSYLKYNATEDHFFRFGTSTYADVNCGLFSVNGYTSSIPQYDTTKSLIYSITTSTSKLLGMGKDSLSNNVITFKNEIVPIPNLFIKHTNDFKDKRVGIYYISHQYKIYYFVYNTNNYYIYPSFDFIPTNPNYLWSFIKKTDGKYVIYNDVDSTIPVPWPDGSSVINSNNYVGTTTNSYNIMIRRTSNLADALVFTINNPEFLSQTGPIPIIKTSTPDYVSNVKSIVISKKNNKILEMWAIFIYGQDGSQINNITNIGGGSSFTGQINSSSNDNSESNVFRILDYVSDIDTYIPLNKYRSLTDAINPKNIISNNSFSASELAPNQFNNLSYLSNTGGPNTGGPNLGLNILFSTKSGNNDYWQYTFTSPQNISGIEIFTRIDSNYDNSDNIMVNLLDSSLDISNPIAEGSFGIVRTTPQNLNNTHKVFTIGSYPDISPTPNPDSPIINVMEINQNVTDLTRITTTRAATTTQYMPTTPTNSQLPTNAQLPPNLPPPTNTQLPPPTNTQPPPTNTQPPTMSSNIYENIIALQNSSITKINTLLNNTYTSTPTSTHTSSMDNFADITPIKSIDLITYQDIYTKSVALTDSDTDYDKVAFDTYMHLQDKKINELQTNLNNIQTQFGTLKTPPVKAFRNLSNSQVLNVEGYLKPDPTATNNGQPSTYKGNGASPDKYPNYLIYGNNGCLQYNPGIDSTTSLSSTPAEYKFTSCNASNPKQQFFAKQITDKDTYNYPISESNRSYKISDQSSTNMNFYVINPIGADKQCLQLNNDGLSVMPCTMYPTQRFKPMYQNAIP